MIYLTQLIFIHPGKEEVFHQFEDMALPLLDRYNGKILYRIRPDAQSVVSALEEVPYEIHFVSFEGELDFNNFLQDETRKDFLHLKADSVRSSLLIKGEKWGA